MFTSLWVTYGVIHTPSIRSTTILGKYVSSVKDTFHSSILDVSVDVKMRHSNVYDLMNS